MIYKTERNFIVIERNPLSVECLKGTTGVEFIARKQTLAFQRFSNFYRILVFRYPAVCNCYLFMRLYLLRYCVGGLINNVLFRKINISVPAEQKVLVVSLLYNNMLINYKVKIQMRSIMYRCIILNIIYCNISMFVNSNGVCNYCFFLKINMNCL